MVGVSFYRSKESRFVGLITTLFALARPLESQANPNVLRVEDVLAIRTFADRQQVDLSSRGALLLPAGYVDGKRYPLVVRVYGGSNLSRAVNRYGLQAGIDNQQLLATRGYAVLLPDTPLGVGTPLADLAATVMPGVDAAVAAGIADPERLAITVHSYGGYSVLAILTQTTRFKAAVSSGGFSNLFSHYGDLRDDGSAYAVIGPSAIRGAWEGRRGSIAIGISQTRRSSIWIA
jgi:dipeptidyl aminopeptidase/acylaminoacyl peptidase